MNLPITLPVFSYTAEQAEQEEQMAKMGIDPSNSLEGSELAQMRFYTIDNVSIYPIEGDGQYSIVSSGGVPYIVDLPMASIVKDLECTTV